MNPKKYTFGVTSGKLLGHMVNERGIEVDPDKIKVILDMPVLRTEKKIRGFLGRLHYISRFMAKLTNICESIFRLLRKNQLTVWNDAFQLASKKIKEYLLSSPVLVPPMLRCPLLLYLSVLDMALGCILAHLDDSRNERAIYYLSKRMLEYEMRYVMIKRLYLSLGWATRRLRHYMTEYLVHLISRLDLLRYLFDRPALTGKLMRWLVLLTEFDIQYVSQKSIKGSIVADHLASLSIYEDKPIDDDFPNEEFITMISLSDRHSATNNIVEYETCILGPETALELGIRQMKVFGDSNLVLKQIKGNWRTKDVKLRSYHAYLEWYSFSKRRLLTGWVFNDLRYTHLPRAQNEFADVLATLASSVDFLTDVVIPPLLIESRFAPAYCCLIGETKSKKIYLELHTLTSPWPFSIWSIDIIGKISPKSSSGHEFILVTIDYFTKWVETTSYARLTSARVSSFIRSHIICHYGVPHELISDKGVHFRAEVDTLLQRYNIQHHKLSAYMPQTNEAVEAANKSIKRILRKMVETSRDWSEKLPFALWA
ncbi:Transposon Tf2-2 polyprotein [Vitis vinifera]|uniref:Transposon Tf2-2 polyprotein n=1 Tax=Vitis vinifera TaxID=29760 RepID=A0A438HJN0_VITVI|nr:Transposon Tf2-2 polyprotein [Vitis vinifera]